MDLRSGFKKLLGIVDSSSSNSEDETNYDGENEVNESLNVTNDIEEELNLDNLYVIEDNMAAANLSFLQTAGQLIPSVYNGDPLGLEAFIASIELVNTIATNEQANLALNFIKSKLAGKALESLADTDNTVALITTALRRSIRPESSKVIEGRMIALRVDNRPVQEYARKAEELADALKRSLIVEGITHAKAGEMAVEKTIEMCRANARSDNIDAILGSKAFTSPKEVVASFVVESAKVQQKQVLAFGHRSQARGSFNNFRGGFHGNNNNRGNFNRNMNSNRSFDQNFGQNSNRFRGFGNQRGNNRGQYSNRSHFRGQYQHRGHHYNNNPNAQSNVRVTYAPNPQENQQQQGDNVQFQSRPLGFLEPNHN